MKNTLTFSILFRIMVAEVEANKHKGANDDDGAANGKQEKTTMVN